MLWHGGHFTGADQRSAALSANGERAIFIDREERLVFLKLGEDALDVVHFFPVFRVGRRQYLAGLAPAITGRLGDLTNYLGTGGLPRLPKDTRTVRHDPGRAFNAIVGWRLV